MNNGEVWSRRWKAQMQTLGLLPENLPTRTYRVKNLEVLPGVVRVSIHEREQGGCTIEVLVKPLSDDQWRHVVNAIAGQTILSTQVASGALPAEAEHVFNEVGASLLPASADEFTTTCSCCASGVCHHLPTVYTAVGDMLIDDPWILFLLRGRARQQVLVDVRGARETLHGAGVNTAAMRETQAGYHLAAPHAEGTPVMDDAAVVALGVDLDRYWGDRQLMKQIHHHIAPPMVELTLLRRLGPLTAADDGMAVYEHLVSLYRSVTEEALALAYASNEED